MENTQEETKVTEQQEVNAEKVIDYLVGRIARLELELAVANSKGA